MMLVGTRLLLCFETIKHACILIKNVYDVMYPFSETKYHCTYIVHTILTVIGKFSNAIVQCKGKTCFNKNQQCTTLKLIHIYL